MPGYYSILNVGLHPLRWIHRSLKDHSPHLENPWVYRVLSRKVKERLKRTPWGWEIAWWVRGLLCKREAVRLEPRTHLWSAPVTAVLWGQREKIHWDWFIASLTLGSVRDPASGELGKISDVLLCSLHGQVHEGTHTHAHTPMHAESALQMRTCVKPAKTFPNVLICDKAGAKTRDSQLLSLGLRSHFPLFLALCPVFEL